MDITELLGFGVDQGASDCHLSAGEPPMIRIDGDLKKLDHPALTQEQVHALVYDIMSDGQRKTFEETHECDFSFALADKARFRVNVFMQRKGEARGISNDSNEDIDHGRTGLAGDLQTALRKRKRLDSRHRADRFR